MKKIYTQPELDVTKLMSEDILAFSKEQADTDIDVGGLTGLFD